MTLLNVSSSAIILRAVITAHVVRGTHSLVHSTAQVSNRPHESTPYSLVSTCITQYGSTVYIGIAMGGPAL